MKELLAEFENNLTLYNEGNLTSDDFFKWLCLTITKLDGKLPGDPDDITNPPEAKLK